MILFLKSFEKKRIQFIKFQNSGWGGKGPPWPTFASSIVHWHFYWMFHSAFLQEDDPDWFGLITFNTFFYKLNKEVPIGSYPSEPRQFLKDAQRLVRCFPNRWGSHSVLLCQQNACHRGHKEYPHLCHFFDALHRFSHHISGNQERGMDFLLFIGLAVIVYE